MATLGGVLAVQHKAQQSQDSGADLDWSSEDSGGSPVLLRQMEDVEESFVTVVQVGGSNAEVPSPGVEKPDAGATPESFVTVLSIGDEEKGVSLNVGCDSGVIEEDVLVYRLPGERLGFGLKFEGGAQSTEKVRRLFIQSCAPDSPASRARASWGPLQEGDEVLAIDSAPVDCMTRIDCVRCLKESHVVIQLRVRHVSSPPPQVVGAEVKKMLPPPPSMPPPPIPPRKGSRKNHQAIVGPPTAFADTNTTVPVPERPQHVNGDLSELWNKDEERAPPEAEVYLDVVSQEAAWAGESESDDTGSSISTVVDRLSTANSSFSTSTCPSTPTASGAANSIDLQRVLDPFEQLEREFQTDSDFLLARTLADTPTASASMSIMSAVDDPSIAVPLQPPLSFQDAPLSYGDEKFVSSIKKSEKDNNEEDDMSVDNQIDEPIPTPVPVVPALPPKPAPRREVPTSKFRSGKKRPPPPPPPPLRAERAQPTKPSIENIQTIPVLKPEMAALPRLVDVVPKERDERSLGALPDVIGHVTERDKTDEIWDEVDRLIQDVDDSNRKQALHISETVETLKETKPLSVKQDEILQSVTNELNLTLPVDPDTLHANSDSSSWETIPLNDEPTKRDFEEVRDATTKSSTTKSFMDEEVVLKPTPSKYENIEVVFNNDSSKPSSVAVISTNISSAEEAKQHLISNGSDSRNGSPIKTSTESVYKSNEMLVNLSSPIKTSSAATYETSPVRDAEADLLYLGSPAKTESSNSDVQVDSLISFDSPVKVHPPVDISSGSPPKTTSSVKIDSPIKGNTCITLESAVNSDSPIDVNSSVKTETQVTSPNKADGSSFDCNVDTSDVSVESISLPSTPVKTDAPTTKLDSHSIGSGKASSETDSAPKESQTDEATIVNNVSQTELNNSMNVDTVVEECEVKESTMVSPKLNVELADEDDVTKKPVLSKMDSFAEDEMLLKITSTETENNTTSVNVCLESVTAKEVTKQENLAEESSVVVSEKTDENNALYCKTGKEDVLFKMDSTMIRSDSLPLQLSPVHVTEDLLLLKVDSPIGVGKTKVSVEVEEVIESSVDDDFPVEDFKRECVVEELSEESEGKEPLKDNMCLKEETIEIKSISPSDDDTFFDVGQSPELIEKEESVDLPEYVLEGNDSDTDSDEFHLALGDLENGSSVFQPAATDVGFFPFRCWGAACHLATIGEDEEEGESSVPPVPGVSIEDEPEEQEEEEEEEKEEEEVEEVKEEENEQEEEAEEVEAASEEGLKAEYEKAIDERKEEDKVVEKEEIKEAEEIQEEKHEEEEEELVEAAVDDDDEEEDQVDANLVPSPASRLDEIVMNAISEPNTEICEDLLLLPVKQATDPEPPISVAQPHEPANGGKEDLHQLCRAAEVTAEKSDSDTGTMEDALQALDSLTSSCSSRLPPDGHEFPPNYQEVAPQEIMIPPPPLPVSGPPAKLEEPTRSPWRSKDEKSECSVRDKIAMFSQQSSANSSPTRRRFNSTEDVFRDSSSVLSFKSQDSLYKSQETLYPSKTQDYLYNGKSSDNSYKAEEPLYTSTRTQDPLYSPKTPEAFSPKSQEPTLSVKTVNSFYSSTKTVETQLPNKSSETLYPSNKNDSIYSNTNGQESLYSTNKAEPLYTASKVPESVFTSTKSQEISYPSTKIQESLYPSKIVQDTYFANTRPLYSGNKGLYKSQETLYPVSKVQEPFFSKSADSGCTSSASSSCSSSAYSSCSPESSLTYSTLPRKLQSKPAATPTLSRATSFSGTLHSRSQSLIDIGPAATGHMKTEEMRRASLNALIEQRRRGYSKLRGLVIPEKVSETSHAIPDLPEIRSVITVPPTATRVTSSSLSTTTSSTTNRWSNNIGQLPTTIPSPPWKSQAQNSISNLPKYSPAFKRKSLSVYTSSKPAGLNLKPSTTPPLRSSCEDESDGDSAVSVSPPPGRVLKAQSVEAINRKNVLSSARHSSGCDLKVGSPLITRKFDEPLHRSDEDDADEEDEDGEEPPTRIAYMEEVVEEGDLPPPPIPVAPIPEKPKPLPAPRRTSIPTPKRQSAPLPPPKPTVPPPSSGDDLLSLLTAGSQLRRQRSRENCETSRIPTSTTVRSNEISRVPTLAVSHEKSDLSRLPSPPSIRENLEHSRISSPPSEKKEAPLFSSSVKKLETTPSPVSLLSKEKPATPSISPTVNTREPMCSPSRLNAQENLETCVPLCTREKPESSRMSALSAPRDSPDALQNPILPASDPPRISTTHNSRRSVSVHDIRKAFEKAEQALSNTGRSATSGSLHARVSSLDSTASEDYNFRGIGDQFGSVTSIASSTSLISPQDLQVLIDEANQPLEDSAVPVPVQDVQVVVLHREGTTGSVGIILAGGADYEAKEITVHKVLSGSPADRDGRIQKGDRILSINGRSMKGVTHRESLNILKAPRSEVVLVVSQSRGASGDHDDETPVIATRSLRHPRIPEQEFTNGPTEAESSEGRGPPTVISLIKDGAGLGFSLEGGKDSPQGDRPLTIKKIFTGGSAEKNGQLKAGDELLNVNGTDVTVLSRIEAWGLMKRLPDGPVSLTVRHKLATV